jgi:hypothetical protein
VLAIDRQVQWLAQRLTTDCLGPGGRFGSQGNGKLSKVRMGALIILEQNFHPCEISR